MPNTQLEVLLHEVREVLTGRLDAISGRLDSALEMQAEMRETTGRIEARQEDVVESLKRVKEQLLTHAERIELLQIFREKHVLECPMEVRMVAVEDFVKEQKTKKGMWKSEFTYIWAVLLVILGGIMGPIGQHFKEAWWPSGDTTTAVNTDTQTTTHTTHK